MRYVAALFAGALVVACTTPAASPSPPPSSAPVVTVAPTAAVSPSPSPPPAAAVVITAHRASIPADPHYTVSWSHRVLLLDPATKTSTEVATFDTSVYSQASFGAISSSRDGRALIVTVGMHGEWSVFLVRPETAEVQPIAERISVSGALMSPDGTRFAIARTDADPSRTGLWVGTVADRTMRRLLADEPAFAGGPPRPYAFSPDGSQLAFGVANGGSFTAALLPFASPEVRVDRSGPMLVPGAAVLGPGLAAEFRSEREVFVWSSASLIGGTTVAYLYDVVAKRSVDVYRPPAGARMEAAWRPRAEEFATMEPTAAHANPPGTAWLRGRNGSARKIFDHAGGVAGIWWSLDGSKLYAEGIGDDSTGGVIELLTGTSVMGFCRRGGEHPRCT